MADKRTQNLRGPVSNTDPAGKIVAVSASDTVDIYADGRPCRALLVGTAGAATVIDAGGATSLLIPLQAGFNPLRVTRVKLTGLTAANIWALE